MIPLNALEPTFFKTLLFTVTVFNFSQPKKAFAPICVTFSPIVTFLSLSQPMNALSAIFVTLTGTPFTFTTAGIVTDLIFSLSHLEIVTSDGTTVLSFVSTFVTVYVMALTVVLSPTLATSVGVVWVSVGTVGVVGAGVSFKL